MFSPCLNEVFRLLPALTRREKQIVIELLLDLVAAAEERDALIKRHKEMDNE